MWQRLAWVLAFLLVLPGLAHAEKQWLRFCTGQPEDELRRAFGYQQLSLQTKIPEDWDRPELKASDALAAEWSATLSKTGTVRMVFDRRNKGGSYDLLYVDANGNNILSDEKPIRATYTHEYGSQFENVKVLFPGDDGPIAYHVSINTQTYDGRRDAYMQTACWYEADVSIDGKPHRVALVDKNLNGAFDDVAADFDKSDRLCLGKGKGRVICCVGKYVEVDGKLYRPQVERDGAAIEFLPAGDVAMGRVRVANDVTTISLGGENGLFHLRPQERVAQVPAGKYRISQWTIDRKDDKGADWKLTASLYQGGAVTVAEGQETALDVGEPITCKLTASLQQKQHQFSQELTARLGERISLERNGVQPDAPKLLITNKDETYRKIFTFQYG